MEGVPTDLYYTSPGVIPVLKASLQWEHYRELNAFQWFRRDTFDQKKEKFQKQLDGLEYYGCIVGQHYYAKPREQLVEADFDFPALDLIQWPVQNANPNAAVEAGEPEQPDSSVLLSTDRTVLKVGKFKASEPGSNAEKNLKKLKKSLKVDKVYNWDTTYTKTNPLSTKFIPEHDLPSSIMRKNDGYSKQEKTNFEERAEEEFGAFEKDEPKKLYADALWEGCTRLNDHSFINTAFHHQLKIRSHIDVETKPALHRDFTILLNKIKQMKLPDDSTLLTVGKLVALSGALWELLNHSSQLNDHVFALTNPANLSPEHQSAYSLLRLGSKNNRVCSTALLQDFLELFSSKPSVHNIGKKAFVEYAKNCILHYNLWGANKPDRVRDRKPVFTKLEDLPESWQKFWNKYTTLFKANKDNIYGKEMKSSEQKKKGGRPSFQNNENRFTRRNEPYGSKDSHTRRNYYPDSRRNSYYRGRGRGSRGRRGRRGGYRGRNSYWNNSRRNQNHYDNDYRNNDYKNNSSRYNSRYDNDRRDFRRNQDNRSDLNRDERNSAPRDSHSRSDRNGNSDSNSSNNNRDSRDRRHQNGRGNRY